MKWPLTFYVDEFKGWGAGYAKGPVIKILKTYEDDVGLYKHELKHVKQWLCLYLFHSLLYKFSKKYRYWAELKAYRVQLKENPEHVETFAGYICDHYDLDVDKQKVIDELRWPV